jgi:hypothetical protein
MWPCARAHFVGPRPPRRRPGRGRPCAAKSPSSTRRARALPLRRSAEWACAQVDQEVVVWWVQPRVLTKPQIAGLKERLDGWLGKVNTVSAQLEGEAHSMALQVS